MFECIREHDGIDVRTLTGMQRTSDKRAFDRALTDLQGRGEIVISGISERLNEHGHKSGWNSTCYMLADRWMDRHGLEQMHIAPEEAKTTLFAWIEPRWEEAAVQYVKRRVEQQTN